MQMTTSQKQALLSSVMVVFVLVGMIKSDETTAGDFPVYDAGKSVARNWNEALLYSIRRDFARPTVHARNLFHASAAMYDGWAVYDNTASTYFLGRTMANKFNCAFTDEQRVRFKSAAVDVDSARREMISHALYRLLNSRFAQSPGADTTAQRFSDLFAALEYDANNIAIDISDTESPAVLGNYLADCIIRFGQTDGANEQNGYSNQAYQPVNSPLNPSDPGTPGLVDTNRWQPLQLDTFIDQSGNLTNTPVFLGAEWGNVVPFSLSDSDKTLYTRNGNTYPVYHDPGSPALLGNDAATNTDYLWGHSLVALWSSHLDPTDGVRIDISPAAIGNTAMLPTNVAGLVDFYNATDGGTIDTGHAVNPASGLPYAENSVLRGDYTRVLAEFWADGPDSETPPGHWFGIYNESVSDHAAFSTRFGGIGEPLSALEFDVRTYFILGGAMHDSAVTAWGIKGWYDYIRPVSALRYMSSRGQSSELSLANYDPQGIPLVPGNIESVEAGDVLAGNGGINVGKIKVRAWRGPTFISDPSVDVAGVGWILLENWWPYQRPTFVTPPFAGYVSGHSTFSRAAAEVLTRVTGDPFFPGGMGEYTAPRNQFLVFEQGPSTDVVLQWATYRDASDQTSLSRIWGGIHPPVDDVPGRRIGIRVGNGAYDRALTFFSGEAPATDLPGASNESSSDGGGGCTISSEASSVDPLLWVLALLAAAKISRRQSAQPVTRQLN